MIATAHRLSDIRWYHTQGAGILEGMSNATDEQFAASLARIIEITDRALPERMCRACRNWNHWHWPDGTCQDARCECPRRPSES